jgi:hypothetical protein
MESEYVESYGGHEKQTHKKNSDQHEEYKSISFVSVKVKLREIFIKVFYSPCIKDL